MFENNPGIHIAIIKYCLVGVLLTVSIVALGWGVWSYTYEQNRPEPPVSVISNESDVRYSEEEWEEIRQAEFGSSSSRYSEEEWEEIRQSGAGSSASSSRYSEEEWEVIMSSQ